MMLMGKVVGRNKDWYVIHPRAPSDLHWQSQIRWVINEADDDDDETDDDDANDDNDNTDDDDITDDDDNTGDDDNTDDIIFKLGNLWKYFFGTLYFIRSQPAADLWGWCWWGVTTARWILIEDSAEATLSRNTLLIASLCQSCLTACKV